jgi:hypothetical protein
MEKWLRNMAWTGDKKALCVMEFFQNRLNCSSATKVLDKVLYRTTYEQNNSLVVPEISGQWLSVCCEMNGWAAGATGGDC